MRAAVKGLILPTDPANEGDFLALDFELPPGLVVSPERPAPVDSYGYVCVALNELVLRAMAPAMPERCPAGSYQLFGIYLYRVDPRDGTPFIFIDPHRRRARRAPAPPDGPTLIFMADGDTPNTPVEVIETRYPVRCERHELVAEEAGAGGGPGVAPASYADFRLLGDGIYAQFGVENVRDTIAKGIGGGGDGTPGSMIAHPGTDREQVFTQRVAFWGPLAAGDLISVHSGGGGGWGHPRDREPERVATDVRDGYVTEEDARDVYGVVLDAEGGIDEDETARLRGKG